MADREADPGTALARPLAVGGQWALLFVASLALALLLQWAGLPAALLLGPMLVGVGFGLGGFAGRVPRPLFVVAQGVIGCLIARSLSPAILATIAEDWAPMLLALATTLGAAAAVALLMRRAGRLPEESVVLGTMPGASTGMVAMAEDFGADPRVVALMQYVRVICVVVATALVSHFWFGLGGAAGAPALAQPTLLGIGDVAGFAATLAVAIGGGALGVRLGIPSGGVLVPMLGAAFLQGFGLLDIVLPEWLLGAAYGVIGWYVGLRFTRDLVLAMLAAIPQMLASAFALIVLCIGSAALLVRFAHADALTAFLATTPGGIDSVAILAAGSHADLAFVFALQAARLILVILIGPALARLIARRGAAAG
ncbi:MAG TPA: AbrB family transcriptional regulator [Hyphomicrobiales bacterium]|nr:AbrB family transcriptional regulator [Hyphomicrobiales bacterium]